MYRPRLFPAFLLCSLAIVSGGCADAGDASHEATTVTDSAGVRIVHNTVSEFDRSGDAWRVSEEPAVVIGSVAGDEAYLFDRIMSVERLSDGRWAVADMGSSQIRYFDARGRHVHSAGRSGQGPGEFTQVMAMVSLAGDTLAVMDFPRRTHLLDEEGRFVGLITTSGSPADVSTYPWGAFRDGTLIAATQSATPQRLTEPHTMTMSYSRLILSGDGESLQMGVSDTIGTWETIRLVPGWRNGANRIQFDVPVQTHLASDGIVVGDPVSNEIRLYDRSGDLRTIVRRDWTPASVRPEDIENARARYIDADGEGGGRVSQQLLDQRAAITEAWVIAEHMPAFSTMDVDAEDNIWLRNYVVNEETVGTWRSSPVMPTRWTVIRHDGILLGEVELPARFLPIVFDRDVIAGIYRDDADVEYIHVYELRKN
jgi:hypothetical protein